VIIVKSVAVESAGDVCDRAVMSATGDQKTVVTLVLVSNVSAMDTQRNAIASLVVVWSVLCICHFYLVFSFSAYYYGGLHMLYRQCGRSKC